MSTWLYLHGRAISRAFAQLLGQPWGTVLSALVVGIALSLPAAGFVLLDNVATLARGMSGTPEISLFLHSGTDEAGVARVRSALEAEAEVAQARFVPRGEALAALEQSGIGDVLGGLGENPLPDAFVVVPEHGIPDVYETLQVRFAEWPEVEHVQLDSLWVQRLHALLGLAKSAVMVLAVLLGVALVIVTFNTIRLQILTQRQEIDVSRLLGATDPFIRRPFYWFGILQGVLGGLVALGTVWGTVAVLKAPVESLAATYGSVFVLNGPQWPQALAIVGFAAFLGWLGSAISVRRHLAEKLS